MPWAAASPSAKPTRCAALGWAGLWRSEAYGGSAAWLCSLQPCSVPVPLLRAGDCNWAVPAAGTLVTLPAAAPSPNAPPQVEQWQRDEIMGFWARHYFPANATLYVVGDIDVQASGS